MNTTIKDERMPDTLTFADLDIGDTFVFASSVNAPCVKTNNYDNTGIAGAENYFQYGPRALASWAGPSAYVVRVKLDVHVTISDME